MSVLRRLAASACWAPVAFAGADVVGRPAPVADARMAPALAPGDVALHDRLSCRLYRFRRGEIVVMKSPDDPTTTVTARLLALEGDWVSARVVPAGAPPTAPRSPARLEVPLGHGWVEVDGGATAPPPGGGRVPYDSPTGWGPIPLALIEGRVVGVVWPPGRVGWREQQRRGGAHEPGAPPTAVKVGGGGARF